MIKLVIAFAISISAHKLTAQYTLKIKKEDNRFLFFQKGIKNDTLIKNKSDIFYMKLPDSLKQNIQIFLKNGQFVKTDNDTLYRLIHISGMKYSHSKPDSVFNTLLEGHCSSSKTISVEFINTKTQHSFLKNIFIAK